MFTGLIAEVGTVERIERDDAGARIAIAAEIAGELAAGDSIACRSAPSGSWRADQPQT